MSKLHYLTALLFIIFLAIASTWVFESIKNSPILNDEVPRHVPDYFLENFTATTTNIEGKLAYKVSGLHLEHYPDDNSLKLTQAIFSLYEDERISWTVRANEALIFQDSQKVYLSGNVAMDQFPNKKEKKRPIKLRTEQLFIDMKKKIATTKSKIKFTQGTNRIQGIGMNADMQKNKIEFMSQVRSRYVSP